MMKKFLSCLLCVVLLLTLSVPAFASEHVNQRMVNFNGTTIRVQMGDGSLCTWGDEDICALLEGLLVTDNTLITIWDCCDAEDNPQNDISPCWYESWENTLVSTSSEMSWLSEMLFSVARGQTITITRSYTSTNSFKLKQNAPFNLKSIEAEGTSTSSYTYQRSESYTGPSDSSPNNTRAFYVRHYYREEVWDQTEYDYALRPQGTIRTTVERPTRSVSFSIDSHESL